MPTALAQLIVLRIVDERIPVRGIVGVREQGGAPHGRLVPISDGEVTKGLEREDRKQVGHGRFLSLVSPSVPRESDIGGS